MSLNITLAILLSFAGGLVMWRSLSTTVVSPHDEKLFKDRYAGRGLKVLAVRRRGTDWRRGGPRGRGPIRKYEIDVELPTGEHETRVRGVSRGQFQQELVWRYHRDGRLEQLR